MFYHFADIFALNVFYLPIETTIWCVCISMSYFTGNFEAINQLSRTTKEWNSGLFIQGIQLPILNFSTICCQQNCFICLLVNTALFVEYQCLSVTSSELDTTQIQISNCQMNIFCFLTFALWMIWIIKQLLPY